MRSTGSSLGILGRFVRHKFRCYLLLQYEVRLESLLDCLQDNSFVILWVWDEVVCSKAKTVPEFGELLWKLKNKTRLVVMYAIADNFKKRLVP